jgi:DNA-binding NarL/FixJ family response regulator
MDDEVLKIVKFLQSRIEENKHKQQAYARLIRRQSPASAPYLQLMHDDYVTLLNEVENITSSLSHGENEESPLTAREQQVLFMISNGLLRKQVAYELGISERTVQFHLKNCIEKLGVENRAEAIRVATKKKYI